MSVQFLVSRLPLKLLSVLVCCYYCISNFSYSIFVHWETHWWSNCMYVIFANFKYDSVQYVYLPADFTQSYNSQARVIRAADKQRLLPGVIWVYYEELLGEPHSSLSTPACLSDSPKGKWKSFLVEVETAQLGLHIFKCFWCDWNEHLGLEVATPMLPSVEVKAVFPHGSEGRLGSGAQFKQHTQDSGPRFQAGT